MLPVFVVAPTASGPRGSGLACSSVAGLSVTSCPARTATVPARPGHKLIIGDPVTARPAGQLPTRTR